MDGARQIDASSGMSAPENRAKALNRLQSCPICGHGGVILKQLP
jgi:hypothetical protein